jgi:threonine/homoserine/homoserine lactone efflux protein
MPEWSALLSLVLTSLAIMGSPGPSTISLTAVSASFGVARCRSLSAWD